MKPVIAVAAALALCAHAAHAQEADPAELARIANELRDMRSHMESIDASGAWTFWGSFLGSMAVAGIAVGATIKYARQLKDNTRQIERQVMQSEEQLAIARDDAANRLRPTLAWGMVEGDRPIRISEWSDRQSGLVIRVINAGQVSARDITMHRDARIVRNDGVSGVPGPKIVHLGALGPGNHIDVLIPVPAETLGRMLSGEPVYIEARFSYKAGGGQWFRYQVGGYVSNMISTLFDIAQEPGAGMLSTGAARAGRRAHPGEPREGARIVGGAGRPQGPGARPEAGGRPEHGRANGATRPDLDQGDRAIEEDPKSATTLRNRGSALHRLGRNVEALGVLKAALELEPADGRTAKEMARVLGSLGRYNDAIGLLGQIAGMGRKDVCVERELVRLHGMLGQHRQAHDALARLAALDPGFATYMEMAATSMIMRQYGMAIDEFGKAAELRPDMAGAQIGKAMAQLNYGHGEEALATLRHAVRAESGSADARVCLAHALYRLGHEEEAREAFGRAAEEDPKNQRAHVNRGVIMRELGRDAEARAAFAAARRLDPSLQVPQVGLEPPAAQDAAN